MTTLKVFCPFLLILLSAFSFTFCNKEIKKKSSALALELPSWVMTDSENLREITVPIISIQKKINPNDSLPESTIVAIQKDRRFVLSGSPYSMKEIFFQSGCIHGSSLVKITNSKVVDNRIDVWTGICSDKTFDTIEFRVFGFGNRESYNFFKQTLIEKTSLAKKYFYSKNEHRLIQTLEEILEIEPAYPYARLNLGNYYLARKNCKKAIRNFRIFFRLTPRFKDRDNIFHSVNLNCKENLSQNF
ncbi:MAG: hypothetical protein L6Q54_02770 [Leptospiraceae bacterium]|nr:hypothetical protein [Leptospiraceae bacterium]MCK6380159.1 hypothetical protein [Leptospiraceae bacterium]NUM41748.1 hypothetical protein [Leptospiraceae bacterium]